MQPVEWHMKRVPVREEEVEMEPREYGKGKFCSKMLEIGKLRAFLWVL